MTDRAKLKKAIEGTGGKFFTVQFIKKDGNVRTMNCRLGVTKGIKGTGNKKSAPNIITVWDAKKKQYRSVNLETCFAFNGQIINTLPE